MATKRKSPPAPPTVPTGPELATLREWLRLTRALGREPTVRELSGALGYADTNAHRLLVSLESKGAVLRRLIKVKGPRELTPVGERWLELFSEKGG